MFNLLKYKKSLFVAIGLFTSYIKPDNKTLLTDLVSNKAIISNTNRETAIHWLKLPVRVSTDYYVFFKIRTIHGGGVPIRCVGIFNKWFCMTRD